MTENGAILHFFSLKSTVFKVVWQKIKRFVFKKLNCLLKNFSRFARILPLKKNTGCGTVIPVPIFTRDTILGIGKLAFMKQHIELQINFSKLDYEEFGTIYQGLLESELSVAETDLLQEKKGKYKGTYRECL